jgi:hypothetical protein
MKITQEKIDRASKRTVADLNGFSADRAVYGRNTGDILKSATFKAAHAEIPIPTATVVVARNDYSNGDAYGVQVPLDILPETIRNLLGEPAVQEIFISK